MRKGARDKCGKRNKGRKERENRGTKQKLRTERR
jgi:hypothetical protein